MIRNVEARTLEDYARNRTVIADLVANNIVRNASVTADLIYALLNECKRTDS